MANALYASGNFLIYILNDVVTPIPIKDALYEETDTEFMVTTPIGERRAIEKSDVGTFFLDEDQTIFYTLTTLIEFLRTATGLCCPGDLPPIGNIPWVEDLKAEELTAQNPGAVDTPLQVKFGAPQATANLSLDAAGIVTALTKRQFFFDARLAIGRTTSPGNAILYFRTVLTPAVGPVVISRPVEFLVDDQNVNQVFQFSSAVNLDIGDSFIIEFYRDSAGINNGGLQVGVPTLGGWTPTASARIRACVMGEF